MLSSVTFCQRQRAHISLNHEASDFNITCVHDRRKVCFWSVLLQRQSSVTLLPPNSGSILNYIHYLLTDDFSACEKSCLCLDYKFIKNLENLHYKLEMEFKTVKGGSNKNHQPLCGKCCPLEFEPL